MKWIMVKIIAVQTTEISWSETWGKGFFKNLEIGSGSGGIGWSNNGSLWIIGDGFWSLGLGAWIQIRSGTNSTYWKSFKKTFRIFFKLRWKMKIRENREKLKIENQPKLKIWRKFVENWNLGKNKNWGKNENQGKMRN